MAKARVVAYDFKWLEALNLRLQNLATEPSSPQPGAVYFDTVSQTIKFAKTGGTFVNPLDRATHTGNMPAANVNGLDTTVKAYRLDEFAAPTGPLGHGGQRATNLANGTAATDAVTKSQLDGVSSSITATRLDQFAAPTAPVSLNSQKITSLANGTTSGDAVNKGQLDAAVSGVTSTRLDQFAAPTAPVSMGNQRITNVADGSSASDAATYGQVQALLNGTDWKNSVRAATTGNITLSATQTVDGVSLAVSDRVLVKNQSTAAQNGIYTVQSGAWTRAADAGAGQLSPATAVFVEEGTANADSQWRITTDGAIVVGTTAIAWGQFGAGSTYTNGTGLTLTGNVFAIDTAVVTRKAAAAIGDGSATQIAVTHNLNTRDVIVTVYDAATYEEVDCGVVHTTLNTVTIEFANAPASNAYRAVVHA